MNGDFNYDGVIDGADVVICPVAAKPGSPDHYVTTAQRIAAETPNSFYPNQYANESNWRAHYDGTGNEIWAQTQGRVTHFVTGIGTSGTVIGTSRRLHELDRRIVCIGMQPDDAWHGLEGLKHIPSSLVPPIYDETVLDETMWMSTDEGWDMSERIGDEDLTDRSGRRKTWT